MIRVMRLGLSALALGASFAGLAAQPSPTAITDRLRMTKARPIDFRAAVYPDTIYIGQQATYQVAVLLSAEARGRLRRNPEFLPPELRGLLSYELGASRRVAPRDYGAGTYEAHVFQRAMFAVAPGRLVVPSPQLTYSMPQSASYFSREERFVVSADSIALVVRPLPEEGRPADFSGAVGNFRATARFDAQTARVGDPLVLTVRIEGIGNVKLLPRPTVQISWASTVPGTERVQVDTTGAFVRGAKEFEYILTPTQPGAAVLPVVRYSYFDPVARRYAVASTAPADLVIADGSIAAAEALDEGTVLPLREWRDRRATRLSTIAPVWRQGALLVVVLLPLLTLGVALTRMRRRRPAVRGESAAAAPVVANAVEEHTPGAQARRVRRAVLRTLAPRLNVAPADLVARVDVQRVLRRRGVTRETTRDVLALLDDLAVAGFGDVADREARNGERPERSATSFEARAEALLQRVDTEAVTHGRTQLWSQRGRRAALPMLLLAAGSVVAPEPATAQAAGAVQESAAASLDSTTSVAILHREAVAAYTARRFPQASERYAALVAMRPDDVDLLVNWGAAAWAAGDTLAAVVAWQRAARLDPLAADIQERVSLLPSGSRAGIADVPMVPVVPLAVAGLVAWCGGWLLLLLGVRRAGAGGTTLRTIGVMSVIVGGLAGGTSWWGERLLDPAALAVVRRPESMRAAPGYEANTMGGVATGDVVRVEMSQEGWDRVVHADGRGGWIPTARLARLTAPLLAPDETR